MESLKRNSYIYKRAVQYALTYALKPNPQFRYFAVHGDGGGDCSNFISQCLYAGGAPMAYNPPGTWWYDRHETNNVNDHAWSVSWSVAHSLYWCLKTRGESKLPGLKGIEMQNMDMLDLGDLIQYEYNGMIYHSTIITGFTYNKGMREPLVTQHSFDALNTSYIKPKATKMHFMKILI